MFEDIIGSKKKEPKIICKLEKNGTIVDNAVVDTSNYLTKGTGYIICDDLQIEDDDCFMLLFIYTKNTNLTRRMTQIFVKRLSDGRIEFKIESCSKT